MLSILIPTFNTAIGELLQELHRQIQADQLPARVLIYDDASSDQVIASQNKEQANALGFEYLSNTENLGRTATRSKLAEAAKTDWLLFLDADVMPARKDYLKSMLADIHDDWNVIFGGIEYAATPPKREQMLRYVYGKKREAKSAVQRAENPHFIISQSLCITKSMFQKCNTITAKGYGLDNLFSNNLKKQKARVKHTDNPVVHLGLESSDTFLEKSLAGIQTTMELEAQGKLEADLRPIQRVYNRLKKFGLTGVFLALSNAFSGAIVKNLKSNKPSLLLFDVYRMNHLIKLKK
ncbi:glycosyltransferase [Gilvibacter sp.]|uniref:glycosyltransferase family 2 protein n=1 Tax=Gilvibacter sp. TaxID=2729997 RepID=UPI0025C04A89|nr:glycosyltransferase [Gilvibacter sp.]NQX78481.1 glycosyltransferase [Gilvibacter sp.]